MKLTTFMVVSFYLAFSLTLAASLMGGPDAGTAVAWTSSATILVVGLLAVDQGWL